MIVRVVLIVLSYRFVATGFSIVPVVVVVVQTFVNVLLSVLRLPIAIVIVNQIDRILVIRIQIRVALYRAAKSILEAPRVAPCVLISVVSLLIASIQIHDHSRQFSVLVSLTDATRPLAVVTSAAILLQHVLVWILDLHTAGPGFP